MAEKTIKTRIIHKHAVESNWAKATNFVPKQGELIIYDDRYFDSNGDEIIVSDSIRWKIGDGVTLVNDLRFTDEKLIARLEVLEKIINNSPLVEEFEGVGTLDAGKIMDVIPDDVVIIDPDVIIKT